MALVLCCAWEQAQGKKGTCAGVVRAVCISSVGPVTAALLSCCKRLERGGVQMDIWLASRQQGCKQLCCYAAYLPVAALQAALCLGNRPGRAHKDICPDIMLHMGTSTGKGKMCWLLCLLSCCKPLECGGVHMDK